MSEPVGRPTQDGNVSSSNDTITEQDTRATVPDETKREEESAQEQKRATTMDKLKQLWAKTQLDVPTMKTMAKGALAPTISLAAYVQQY